MAEAGIEPEATEWQVSTLPSDFIRSYLFSKVLIEQLLLAEQWLFAKVTPVPKKGIKSRVENYILVR